MKDKAFLIVGGGFGNKGAEAMLFVMISELKNRFPNCKILYSADEDKYGKSLNATFLNCDDNAVSYAMGGYKKMISLTKYMVKKFIGRHPIKDDLITLNKNIENIQAIFDISGYSLSSKWPSKNSLEYLKRIELAKKNSIPFYIMPQSFGPFEYTKDCKKVKKRISELLSYPNIIFTREELSKQYLLEEVNLKNIILSCDIVLQNKSLNINEVFLTKIDSLNYEIQLGSIGIIPSLKNFEYTNKNDFYNIYNTIIEYLLKYTNKKIYIISHSNTDTLLCKKMLKNFEGNERICLLDKDFNCLDFCEIVKKFDFLIASRYHSIVHAYKNKIPCVILGWSNKYMELSKLLGQEKYMYDIKNINNVSYFINLIENMIINFEKESEIIEDNLTKLQSNSIFNILEEELR